MKRFSFLLLLIALCCATGEALYKIRKGFSIRRVQEGVKTQLEIWDKTFDAALAQPYRFLGRGRQCFAFESLDGKYVLKFPRTDIYRIPLWMRTLPFCAHLRTARETDQKKREKAVLESMRIAYEKLHDDTGALALHFGQTPDLGQWITLRDPIGIAHRIPAHKAAFVLQLKRPILMRAFVDSLKKGEREQAKRILDAFIDVVVARGKKGIANKDGSFLRNYGYDGIKGYQIDIGSFYFTPDGRRSIADTMGRVRSWLETTDRDMLAYFEDALQKKIALAFD